MRASLPWIQQTSSVSPTSTSSSTALERAAPKRSRYTVGWIDCLTRGASHGPRHPDGGPTGPARARRPQRFPGPHPRITMPLDLPSFVLNASRSPPSTRPSTGSTCARERRRWSHWETLLLPARRDPASGTACTASAASRSTSACSRARRAASAARACSRPSPSRGGASFLCVIKDCGPEGAGLLSFPMEGISDRARHPGARRHAGARRRAERAGHREGGRIYLTKDQFTRPEHFQAMEPRLARFQEIRRRWDPEARIKSAQSVRLFGDRV
jgi:decaprenylphospho-beta-D-ribofuranose 2-oxidase